MFGLESLDIMIGLITVYLMFGMVCTTVVEAIMSATKVRSKNLEAALKEFLHDSKMLDNASVASKYLDAFYNHPLVLSLSKGDNGRPSYIPNQVISQVILEIIMTFGIKTIEDAIKQLPADSRIQGILSSLYKQTGEDNEKFRQAIESHFDSIMDRASGWVKREATFVTQIVAILLVVLFNVDTINIYNSLATNPEVRSKLIEVAQQLETKIGDAANKSSEPAATASEPTASAAVNDTLEKVANARTNLQKTTDDLHSAGVDLGWKVNELPTGLDWINKILGLLISSVAISLGAPFWFDVLQKFMRVRSSGVKKDQ